MSFRASINAVDAAEIHCFSLTLWFTLLADITAVSTAFRMSFHVDSEWAQLTWLPVFPVVPEIYS